MGKWSYAARVKQRARMKNYWKRHPGRHVSQKNGHATVTSGTGCNAEFVPMALAIDTDYKQTITTCKYCGSILKG